MKITEQTTTRLVIQYQRRVMAWVLALFTILSLFFLLNTLYEGITALDRLRGWQWYGWITWLIFALAMLILGAIGWSNAGQGMTLIFDKQDETLRIRRPKVIRVDEQAYSIYAVSHMDIEGNDEFRVYGVFLVLRSGERIALATVPVYDEAHVRELSKQVLAFLRQKHDGQGNDDE